MAKPSKLMGSQRRRKLFRNVDLRQVMVVADFWDEIGIPAPSAYLISNNTAQVSHPIEPLVIPTQYVDLD